MPEDYDPEAPAYEDIISHARGIPYYTLCEMQSMIKCAHKLYNLEIGTFDELYLLKIINYGELQRNCRNFSSFKAR